MDKLIELKLSEEEFNMLLRAVKHYKIGLRRKARNTSNVDVTAGLLDRELDTLESLESVLLNP